MKFNRVTHELQLFQSYEELTLWYQKPNRDNEFFDLVEPTNAQHC